MTSSFASVEFESLKDAFFYTNSLNDTGVQ